MTVTALETPKWSARQCLLAALDSLPDNATLAVAAYRDSDGQWQTVTSSITTGDLLVAAEILRMRALENIS